MMDFFTAATGGMDHETHFATEAESHREWHDNAGVPMGPTGGPCPWDACGWAEPPDPDPTPPAGDVTFALWVDGRLFDVFGDLTEAYQAAKDYPDRDTVIDFVTSTRGVQDTP